MNPSNLQKWSALILINQSNRSNPPIEDLRITDSNIIRETDDGQERETD